jgi:UDP:flavonoid glycosyltransferase YjiC (YdhE family)
VRSHIFTDRPWLAADPTLGPWPDPADQAVFQTGAWILTDGRPLSPEVEAFLDAGEPPIVFTLGSAAVLDARDFFDQSVEAARSLGRRAVMLYGLFSEPPRGLDGERVGFGYAPYSQVFGRAACVVHQGGAGTTGQALRAGVPQLIVPFGHDQPDNAARCRRAGVAESLGRDEYNAESAAKKLSKILNNKTYAAAAREAAEVVRAEHGTKIACDAIEDILRKPL